jgi:hypothetical protein
VTFNHTAEMRPFGEVLQVKCDVVGLGEVVEVAGIEIEEVHGRHWPDGRHGDKVSCFAFISNVFSVFLPVTDRARN